MHAVLPQSGNATEHAERRTPGGRAVLKPDAGGTAAEHAERKTPGGFLGEAQHWHAEKRRIKQQLKDYDQAFYKQHGRMPLKAEKEPIRDLYEVYHAIKAKLTTLNTKTAL